VVERPDPAQYPQHLCLDKAYDNPTGHTAAEAAGYIPHIRRIGEEKLDAGERRHPARRWVVGRTLAWLQKCRAILVRYDKKARRRPAARRTHPSEDPLPQMLWRQVHGQVLARRGELQDGERLVREAVALAEETDMLNSHADALIDLAEVLALAGQDPRAELDRALALYEQKGNLVMAERKRSRLAELTAPR
jgi:hypothetical protein